MIVWNSCIVMDTDNPVYLKDYHWIVVWLFQADITLSVSMDIHVYYKFTVRMYKYIYICIMHSVHICLQYIWIYRYIHMQGFIYSRNHDWVYWRDSSTSFLQVKRCRLEVLDTVRSEMDILGRKKLPNQGVTVDQHGAVLPDTSRYCIRSLLLLAILF